MRCMSRSLSSSSEPVDAAKEREIVLAFEGASGGGHGGFVERPGIVEGAAVVERRQDFTAIDAVTVGFSLR